MTTGRERYEYGRDGNMDMMIVLVIIPMVITLHRVW